MHEQVFEQNSHALTLLSATLVCGPRDFGLCRQRRRTEASGNESRSPEGQEGQEELEHRRPEIPRRLSRRLRDDL